jgi:hypothetical protein
MPINNTKRHRLCSPGESVERDLLKQQDEQRVNSRFDCIGSALVYFVPSQPPLNSCIIDLSVTGGLIVLRTPRETAIGTILEVAFTVNQLHFRVRAQVRAIRSPQALGLVFIKVQERVKLNLQDLIEELAANHLKRSSSELLIMLDKTETPSLRIASASGITKP